MVSLDLKIGTLTPVHFVKAIDPRRVVVKFGGTKGIAALPSHINAHDLLPGTPLDVRITALSSSSPSFTFEAAALNVIDKDMLALMFMMHKMFENASTPRSKTLEELKNVIGVRRVTGRLLAWSKFTPPSKETVLEVTVGHKNLRAYGTVPETFEKLLDETGRNGELTIEILGVNPDEKAANNFCAKVLVKGGRETYCFNVGIEDGRHVKARSSVGYITKIIMTFSARDDYDDSEPDYSKTEVMDVSRLFGESLSGEYASTARSLIDDYEAKELTRILYMLYHMMSIEHIENRNLIMKEILNALADVRLGTIREVLEHIIALFGHFPSIP